MSRADEPPETTPTLRRPVPKSTAESYLSHGPSLVMVLVASAITFLLGVRFYVETMPAVPTLLWPLYADSPTAIALATLSAATLLPVLDRPLSETPINRPLAYLHTLAFVWLVKYGLWVAVALNRQPALYFDFDADGLYAYWGIIGSHLLFVGFAFAILHYGRRRGAHWASRWGCCSPTTSSTTGSATTRRCATSPASWCRR